MSNLIKDALELQKRELETIFRQPFIPRKNASIEITNPMIKVIIGPRRAGKSFFGLNALKDSHFGYINFDDEILAKTEDYNELITAAESVYNRPQILFLDEIQNLPKWELFVNRLQRQGYNLVLTGSNSNLLSSELSTHLTGRYAQTVVFPLSFREIAEYENQSYTSAEMSEKFSDYLIHGGYPEPYIKKLNYKDYLSTLFHSVLYKDIVRRHNIRYSQAIGDMAEQLLANTARPNSVHSLGGISKIKSPHTLAKYLAYLEDSFLFFSARRFSYKVREQLSSIRKIYCADNGFIHARAFRFSRDWGVLLENLVAVELKKRELRHEIQFYYWANPQREEVDFIVKENLRVSQLIQVCWNTDNAETNKREIRAILKAGRELQCDNLLIITSDKESSEEIEWYGRKAIVKFIPVWKWLMDL